MRMNLIARFRKFWGKLTEREREDLWNILTALRGADSGGDKVKFATTARIRGELLGKQDVKFISGSYAFCSKKDADKEYGEEIDIKQSDVFEDSGTHFTNHVICAIRALEKHVPGKQIKDLLKLKYYSS